MNSSAADLFTPSQLTAAEWARAMRTFGMSQPDLTNEANRARLVRGAFLLQTADRIKRLCAELGLQVSEDSIVNVAANLSVDASAEFPKGHPLTPRDRQIAEELVYHWVKALRPDCDEASARNSAKQRVKFGERGRTVFHSIGETFFGYGR